MSKGTKNRLGAGIATLGLALALSAVMGRRPDAAPSGPDARARAGTPARRAPSGRPKAVPASGWWGTLVQLYEEVDRDRVLAVAAGVTFYGLLAIFPTVAAVVSLYGLVADPGTINGHLATASGFLPGGALDVIGDQVKRITSKGDTTLGLAFFTGLGLSLWSANAGMKAMFDALNVAYGEREKRGFVLLNAVALAFTLGSVLFLVVAMTSVVAVPVALKLIGLGGLTDWLVWLGRWPLLLGTVLAGIVVLDRLGPSRERPRWRWVGPGSLLAAAGWLLFSMLFSWYVGSFGSYNETYGSLGAAIGFMTWMWLSATIILVGAELNAITEDRRAEASSGALGRAAA